MTPLTYIWNYELPYCDPSRGDYSTPVIQAFLDLFIKSPWFTPFVLIILAVGIACYLLGKKKWAKGIFIFLILFILFWTFQLSCD